MEQKGFSRLSSETISALRFPLMVGIVFIHFGVLDGITIQGVEYGSNPPYWLVLIQNLFSQVLSRIGVPLFFLISGYLFFLSGLTGEQYEAKLLKRAGTLLVPYILWNIVFILYYAVRSLHTLHWLFPNAMPGNWSLLAILGCFLNSRLGVFANSEVEVTNYNIYPQCVPMWYVRDLMIVVVLSPLLHWLIRKAGWYFVIALGVAWFFASTSTGYFHEQIPVAVFFFSWGACLSVKRMDFVQSMRRCGFALWLYPIVAIADTLTKEWAYNVYLHNVGIIFGIFAAVSLTAWLLENGKIKVNKFLATSSFFLFALHTLLMNELVKVIVRIFFCDSPIYMAVLYLFVPITNIAICLVLYWLLRRYVPRLCALLTGGR